MIKPSLPVVRSQSMPACLSGIIDATQRWLTVTLPTSSILIVFTCWELNMVGIIL